MVALVHGAQAEMVDTYPGRASWLTIHMKTIIIKCLGLIFILYEVDCPDYQDIKVVIALRRR